MVLRFSIDINVFQGVSSSKCLFAVFSITMKCSFFNCGEGCVSNDVFERRCTKLVEL